MSEIEVLVPIAETRSVEHPLAARPAALAACRVGMLDNCKANAMDLLAGVRDRLGLDGDIVTCRKDATAAAPDDVMAHLERCDAVVLAIAD